MFMVQFTQDSDGVQYKGQAVIDASSEAGVPGVVTKRFDGAKINAIVPVETGIVLTQFEVAA